MFDAREDALSLGERFLRALQTLSVWEGDKFGRPGLAVLICAHSGQALFGGVVEVARPVSAGSYDLRASIEIGFDRSRSQ